MSKNFVDHRWFTDKIGDPYKLLPPVFTDAELKELTLIYGAEKLADGGAAMTAYAKMQFMDISADEHKRLSDGLLRYCELDTMAMVMIMEGFWEMSR